MLNSAISHFLTVSWSFIALKLYSVIFLKKKKNTVVFKYVFVFIALLSSCQEECGFHPRGLRKLQEISRKHR